MREPLQSLRRIAAIVIPLVLVVGATAAVLLLLNRLGGNLQRETGLREYPTIEEAQNHLRKTILLPSYFPATLSWPPRKILAEKEPYARVLLLFARQETNDVGLALMENYAGGVPKNEGLPELPRIEKVVADSLLLVGDKEGRFSSGWGKDKRRWSMLSWQREGITIVVITSLPSYELLRIAKSMERGQGR